MPSNFNVLENYRDPYASQRKGPNALTQEYPRLSGFLQGVLGMAPDEAGTGSVLDMDTAENRRLQQLGAKYGFPIGTLAQMLPFGGGVAKAPGAVAGSRTAQRGVIKAPGGNWLSGSIPDAVKGLRQDVLGDTPRTRELLGDAMAHCVGGYCPDVLEGRSRIFSLRDAKGKPHVTIETQPNDHLDYNKWITRQPEELRNRIKQERAADPVNFDAYSTPEYLSERAAQPPRIKQIKSYSNKAPLAEHLPYVQDFVRSGKWSDVGDLENAGLYRRRSLTADEQGFMPELGDYLSLEDVQKMRLNKAWTPIDTAAELDIADDLLPRRGFADGGLVQHQYNPAAIDARAAQLLEELEF